MKSSLKAALCAGIFLIGLTSTANATLEIRLGGDAYYDTVLDITWATDANINGLDTWDNQQTWVSGLTIDGIGGWRLPSADVNGDNTVVDCFGGNVVGCSDNEMGHLFWEEGITNQNLGVFTGDFFTCCYWTGTEYPLFPGTAWNFWFDFGSQGAFAKGAALFAWAVHDGDVGAIPVPGTIALMGLGLACLLGFGRRQR